jgi:hypothetical protein
MNPAAIVLSIIALLTTIGLLCILLSFLEKEPIKPIKIDRHKSYTYSEYKLSNETYATVVDIDE